ncbi:MAG: THUMP domain-containing protein [Acidobacteriota bacterium]|nr:THUMP domain-containing protein [Acidobacteriota bacterium]
MFAFQEDGRYFAQAARGIEEPAKDELQELGARDVEISASGLYFRHDAAGLYRVNYCSRLVSRVLAPLTDFPCFSEQALYDAARAVPWEELLSPERTFAVFANVRESRITHSQFAALRVKDAIADHFRDRCGRRPDVDPENPDAWIHLSIRSDRAVLSLDASNGSLHRRGYRMQSVPAPLQETLAAALVRLSGWQGEQPLVDPMCGSGTILAEAYMHYCRIPPAFKREKFGFELMPGFDPQVWEKVRRESDAARRMLPEGLIRGSDSDRQAVSAARENLREIPGTRGVAVERRDFHDLPGIGNAVIVCNPPYGVRVGEKEAALALAREFGDFLKQRCQGSTAYVLCGSQEMVKAIGLKPSRRFVLFNGSLECRLLKIEIY